MNRSVGFIGLGKMGYLMAGNLTKLCVTNVWNRTSQVAVQHTLEYKSIHYPNIKEMSKHSDVIITCLPTSNEVYNISKELFGDETHKTKYLIDCTSGDPFITQDIGALVSEKGVEMFDCPVSGGPGKAKEGTLCAMVGGEYKLYKEIEPIVSMFAQPQYVGELGHGHAVKAVNNVLNVSQLCLAMAGISSLEKLGVDPLAALKVINQSSGRSLMTQERIPNDVITKRYSYGFDLILMKKDVEIAMKIMKHNPIYPSLWHTYNLICEALEKFGEDIDYTEVTKIL
jgi:3-hydroxyisobutyrate dehydrogenase